MRTLLIFSIALITCLSSCEFHQSINKDLVTGATSRGDGISSEVAIQINGVKENRNTFVHSEIIEFIFTDIEGLKRVEDLVFPGLSMHIIKNDVDTVLSEQDLFASLEEGTDLDPLELQARFRAVLPYQNQERYRAFVKLWDKKSEATFAYEVPFEIIANDVLKIESQDISFSNIYLWNNTDKTTFSKSEINREDELMLLLEAIEGLSETDGMVYPQLSFDLIDDNGNEVLSNKNLLSDYASGIKKEDLATQIPITISFSDGIINPPVKLTAILSDLNSQKELVITGSFEIQ